MPSSKAQHSLPRARTADEGYEASGIDSVGEIPRAIRRGQFSKLIPRLGSPRETGYRGVVREYWLDPWGVSQSAVRQGFLLRKFNLEAIDPSQPVGFYATLFRGS